MMKSFLKRILIFIAALLTSCLLVFSVTIANLMIKGDLFREKTYVKTEVKMVAPEQLQQKIKEPKPAKKPQRQKSNNRSPKSGPRFAMELGAIGGAGGALISTDLVSGISGGGQGSNQGDVDEKPSSRSLPSFQPPAAIRDAEIDAVLRLSFCVDVSGKPYDIKTVEETPAGMGLAASGREALSKMTFSPAKKDGKPLAFCGMEQPFEIRFRD